jgi:gluconate 2-dehydrogenase gamma chain
LLKRIGAASTAAVVPAPLTTPDAHPDPAVQAPAAAAPPREAYETLTAAESDVLEAMTGRLIPTDGSGPGAREARAAHYIDRALAGPLAGFRANYTAGLASLDEYARARKGARFAELPPADQDALLSEIQSGTATGFAQPPAIFFNLVRSHTIEGTFSDPYYGGNANFVGWDLIGYPGVRTSVAASDQQMNARVAPNHRSAYDFAMFRKGGTGGR